MRERACGRNRKCLQWDTVSAARRNLTIYAQSIWLSPFWILHEIYKFYFIILPASFFMIICCALKNLNIYKKHNFDSPHLEPRLEEFYGPYPSHCREACPHGHSAIEAPCPDTCISPESNLRLTLCLKLRSWSIVHLEEFTFCNVRIWILQNNILLPSQYYHWGNLIISIINILLCNCC